MVWSCTYSFGIKLLNSPQGCLRSSLTSCLFKVFEMEICKMGKGLMLLAPLKRENRTKCRNAEIHVTQFETLQINTHITASQKLCCNRPTKDFPQQRAKEQNQAFIVKYSLSVKQNKICCKCHFCGFHHNILIAHKAIYKTERGLLFWPVKQRAEWSAERCNCFCLIFGRQRAPDESRPQAICPPWTPLSLYTARTDTHTHRQTQTKI